MMSEIWVDPPGALYAISYVTAAAGFMAFIRRPSWNCKKTIKSILFAAFLILFMFFTDDMPQIWFWPCLALEFAALYELMYCGNDMNQINAMYYTFHMFIIGEFTASLEWLICFFIVGGELGKLSVFQAFNLLVVYILVYGSIYLISRKLYRTQIDVNINGRELAMVAVICFTVFCMSNLSYVPVNTPFSAQLPREIFNIHTWVDLGGLAILFAYHTQLIELQMKVDFDNMQNILDMQYANYQISKRSVDMVNQKYHDLKHQINLLRAEFGSRDALEYLDKMESEIESYEAQNKTGNKILDTILTGKSLYCQQNDIKLTVVADGSLLNFMDIMDISSLFGNALDNAIESVGAISDKEKRLIHLTISKDKGFIRIRMENCYGGELDFENGLPQTTKRDRNYHGYGLKSIRSTVQKYNGSVRVEAKEGWFELRILIPGSINEREEIVR